MFYILLFSEHNGESQLTKKKETKITKFLNKSEGKVIPSDELQYVPLRPVILFRLSLFWIITSGPVNYIKNHDRSGSPYIFTLWHFIQQVATREQPSVGQWNWCRKGTRILLKYPDCLSEETLDQKTIIWTIPVAHHCLLLSVVGYNIDKAALRRQA
jgi:hypothetical protein